MRYTRQTLRRFVAKIVPARAAAYGCKLAACGVGEPVWHRFGPRIADWLAGGFGGVPAAGSGPLPLIAVHVRRPAGHARERASIVNRVDRGVMLTRRSPRAMSRASLARAAAAESVPGVGPQALGWCPRQAVPAGVRARGSQTPRVVVACRRLILVVRASLQTSVAQASDVSVWSG